MVYATNTNQAFMRFKNHTYATEVSTTSTSGAEATNFTFDGPGLLWGIQLKCQMKESNASYQCHVHVRVSGTSTGTYYILGLFNGTGDNYSAYPETSQTSWALFVSLNTSYEYRYISALCPIVLADETITVSVWVRTNNASYTAYVQNIDITAYWLSGYVVES